jgi:D-arabinose 1-dehydrogenase-like Zn-dependent alcohol dehydrogenase
MRAMTFTVGCDFAVVNGTAASFKEFLDAVASGEVRVRIGKAYPLEDIAQAH